MHRGVKRLPIIAPERRVLDHAPDHRHVVRNIKEIPIPVMSHAQSEINVPRKKIPSSAVRAIHEGVLAAMISVAVPIPDDMTERNLPHPLPHVRNRLQGRSVLIVRKIARIHEMKQTRVIVIETCVCRPFPVPPVTCLLLLSAGREKQLQRGVPDLETAVVKVVGKISVFRPVVHLEQFAVILVRKPFAEVVPLDVMRVRVDVGILDTVQADERISLITGGQPQLLGNLITHAFTLQRRIAIALKRIEVQFVHSEEYIVRGELDAEGASPFIHLGVRHADANPWTAAPTDAGIVDYPSAIHKRRVEILVAVPLACFPFVNIGLGHPEAIRAEISDRINISKPHQALPNRRVGREIVRRHRGIGVPCPDMKRHQLAMSLPRDKRAVNSSADVYHVRFNDRARRIQAIAQPHVIDAVGIMYPGSDLHGLARCRHRRRMRHIPDRRPDIRPLPAVSLPRCAEIFRNRQHG